MEMMEVTQSFISIILHHSFTSIITNWWGVQDSNLRRHRRRIYSPFPLATRATPQSDKNDTRTTFTGSCQVPILVTSAPPDSGCSLRERRSGHVEAMPARRA